MYVKVANHENAQMFGQTCMGTKVYYFTVLTFLFASFYLTDNKVIMQAITR